MDRRSFHEKAGNRQDDLLLHKESLCFYVAEQSEDSLASQSQKGAFVRARVAALSPGPRLNPKINPEIESGARRVLASGFLQGSPRAIAGGGAS